MEDLDGSAVVAIVAAAISLAAFLASVHQAKSARQQAQSAGDQVTEAREQTALQRQMHRDAAQPYVWLDIRPDDGHGQLIKVVLENGGPTVATNIRVTIDPPLPDMSSRTGAHFSGLDAGVSALAPGRSMRWSLGTGAQLFSDPANVRAHQVTIDARGPFGPAETVRYTIDLGQWSETSGVPPGTLHEVRNAIVDLRKTIAKRK